MAASRELDLPVRDMAASRELDLPVARGSVRYQPGWWVSCATFARDFLLGGTSGAIAKTFTAPIERTKLVLQMQDANKSVADGTVKRYRGVWHSIRRIQREQGLRSLWRGNAVNVVRYVPTQASNLALKDTFRRWLPRHREQDGFWRCYASNIAAGGLAGAVTLVFVYPLDYTRTRLSCDVTAQRQFTCASECIWKTVQGPEGLRGIYKGFWLGVSGIVVYRGLQFGSFDTAQQYNPWHSDRGLLGLLSTFAAAQTSALIPTPLMYPMDTVRRRFLTDAEKPRGQRMYHSGLDCMRQSWRTLGVRGFYAGFLANALRTVGVALVLATYDRAQQALARPLAG